MSKLIAELTATCNALGYGVDCKNKYFVDKECKESIRELIRFLRRDDENHEIRRFLGSASILQTDLIPIVINHHDDEELLDLLLRLLVNLTTPALLLYNEELPVEKISRQYYLSLIRSLQQYKQAFTKQQLWSVLNEKLSYLLKMDWADRGEEKSLIIIRILILVRNVLHVPTDTDVEKRPDNDASIHDQVLWALHEGGMINLILYIATSESERQYYFHVLEIISLMLRDQNAEVLASASVQRSIVEKQRDEQELMALRKKEIEEKQKKMKKYIAARHSRFGGLFVVQGIKAIGDNDLVVNSLDSQLSSSFDRRKNKVKTPKNRLPMQSENVERRSAFSVRILMKEFCIEFLNGAYNNLMRYIREILYRGKAQPNDESYYFWALRFFMEFNRHFKFEVKLISETIDITIFHFTQDRIEDWRAKLVTDKKKIHLWSKRMHLGLKAYKELLCTLLKMYQHPDKGVMQSACTMMSNIFYVVEYREFLMGLLNLFDETKFSKEYLTDLIESNHIFMKILEHFCKRHRSLVVQKKVKLQKRKKKTKKSEGQNVLNNEATSEKWNLLQSRITEILETNADFSVQQIPFDAASEVPFEEQKVDAMRRIRFLLLKMESEEAVSLLRASREVWSENDCFGNSNMTVSDECAALKEIFFANIGLPAAANIEANNEIQSTESSESSGNEENSRNTEINVNEQNFQFMDFVKKFAKPKIVYACCLLLSQFEKNTVQTNHCILKLLHRIAFDCKYSAILFQASVFRTFQRILDTDENEHKELKKFAVHIIRNFMEIAEKNKKVYMELLFWKGNKEAYEIVEGYGSMSSGNSGKVAWTEEQEDELQRLFDEYQKDKPDRDLVDWIHSNLIDQSRSRRGLIRKMREMNLLEGSQKRISTNRKPSKEFSEEEITQITDLFNEFKEAFDIVGCIMERLNVYRPKKQIIDKIVQLNLVHDRKELRIKRSRKSNAGRDDIESDDRELETDNDSESDEDNKSIASNDIPNVTHYLSPIEVIKNVKEVVSLGMKEAVEWIVSSLLDVLDDLGDEESDVPILPIANYSIKAIDSRVFQRLLLSIGIKLPVNFQEMYWRIPGSWQANDLRKRISLLNDGLNENLNTDNITHNNYVENVMNQDDLQRLESGTFVESLEDTSENDIQIYQNKSAPARSSENICESDITNNIGIPSIENKKRKRFSIEKFIKKNHKLQCRTKKQKKVRETSEDNKLHENGVNECIRPSDVESISASKMFSVNKE